jgi:predicted transcriptional regulator
MKMHHELKAIELRKAGMSIKEIAKELQVSQSSVSRWCSDIILTDEQRDRLDMKRKEAGIKALRPWIEKNKQKKIADIASQVTLAKSDVDRVSKRDLFVLGLGLYWGEGYKRGSQELGFTNSDPKLLLVFIKWLQEIYAIPRSDLIARVTINKNYFNEAARIKKYWSEVTNIPIQQFTTTSFIVSGKEKLDRDARTYRGTLRIKIRRGTSLRRRILSSIEEMAAQISLNSRNTFS